MNGDTSCSLYLVIKETVEEFYVRYSPHINTRKKKTANRLRTHTRKQTQIKAAKSLLHIHTQTRKMKSGNSFCTYKHTKMGAPKSFQRARKNEGN